MSETIDVNVLVYASTQSAPEAPRAQGLLQHLAEGPGLVVMFWPVLVSYVRIVTDRRIVESPLSYDEAASAVERLIGRPHIRTAGEGTDFWRAFRLASDAVAPKAKLVPDAHLVALMLEHGVSTIWTRDTDFRKFDGITARNPFNKRYADGFAS